MKLPNRHGGHACLSSLIFLAMVIVAPCPAQAATARNTTIEVTAQTSAASPHVTLNWPATGGTGLKIWVRAKGGLSWGTATTLAANAISYADTNAQPGVAYEYSIQASGVPSVTTSYGAIVAGYNIPLVEHRGQVILLVDNTMSLPLAPEIEQLQQNLVADGWSVYRHDVPRETVDAATTGTSPARLAEVQNVRALIQSDYNTAPGGNWALLILGRVPAPYSGMTAPDGHGSHYGAWPTDSYYADIDGTWNDTASGGTSAGDKRNWNVAGDGKFDPSYLPSKVELQCGRVDFAKMSNVPTGVTETQLLRQYLVREHRFRRNIAPFDSVARRGIIDTSFNYFAGEAFASAGWRTIFSWFGRNAGQADELDWFTTLQSTPMLFAYGDGAGLATSAAGVGDSINDFNHKDSKAVFCMTFGSNFGDWDSADNFLRAPLAGTSNSLGLVNMWSGRGYFSLFHMALGDIVGYSARYTENNIESPYNGAWPTNGYTQSITYNLMGDPTLRLHSVSPPSRVAATSSAGGIALAWSSSPDAAVIGYHVYRSTSASGPFTRITGTTAGVSNPTGSPLGSSAVTFTDTDPGLVAGTAYTYLVKAVKMEATPSGTYVNQSVGEGVVITHLAAVPAPVAPTRLTVSRTAGSTCVLNWDDNATDETGYLIERSNPLTGAWSQIQSLAANTVSATDISAPVGQTVSYRVRASGATNSAYSNTAADYNLPGQVGSDGSFFVADKTTGTFLPVARRWNGTLGDIGVKYTTSDLLSTASTDYTATTGTVTWLNGQMGTKSSPVSIANLAGLQLTKIFKVTYSNATNGSAIGSPAGSYCFITDALAQTLPAPWVTTTFGATSPGSEGYAEYAGGSFGIAGLSSAIYSGNSASDSARFLYVPVTGDCQLTARLGSMPKVLNNSNVAAGIMIRGGLTPNSATDALVQPHYTTNFRATRSGSAGSLSTAYTSSPMNWADFSSVWMRLTRTGSTVSISQSPDGTNWTKANADVVFTSTSLPAAAYVGFFICSETYGVPVGPPNYARFSNVTIYTVPTAVANLTASGTGGQSGQISLNWDATFGAGSYRVERSTTSGSGFVQINEVSTNAFIDTGLVAGQTYYYRVKATSPAGPSPAYSSEASAAPFVASNVNGWRYTYFGTESNTGDAGDLATPAGDGIANLVKYAIGVSPFAQASSRSGVTQVLLVGGTNYLTMTFTRLVSASDVTLSVEAANTLNGTWSSFDPLDPVNQVSVQNDSPAAGVQTITVKDEQPFDLSPSRFLRLRVTRP